MIEHRAILITETLSDIYYSSLDIKSVFKKEDVIQIINHITMLLLRIQLFLELSFRQQSFMGQFCSLVFRRSAADDQWVIMLMIKFCTIKNPVELIP